MWETRELHTGFWWGNVRERDHLKDRGADGRIILEWIFTKWDGLVQSRDRWRADVMRFSEMREKLTKDRLASQVVLRSMDLFLLFHILLRLRAWSS